MDLQQVLSALEKADAAGDTQAAQELANLARSLMGGQALQAPSTKPAGFSFKDIATAFGQGAVGSTEAIANVAGAGNVVSQGLGSLTESLQKQYSPERQAEMQRQQERMKKAEESGSTWEEIKAGVQNIYEAPLQSVAQGLGSFVPYVPAIFAGPAAAALGLTGRALTAAKMVEKAYAPLVGTAQGAGTVKGAIYDAVYKAEKESGIPEDEARQKADAAQSYAGKNLDQIALGAGLGYVASKGGVEKFLTKEGREKAGEKALLPRVGGAMAEETLTEGAQGGQERLAQNIALQRTGRDVPTFQGVAGQAAQEGIIGGITAGPISAISGGKSKEEIEQERLKKERDAFEEQRKAFAAQQEKTKENLQVPETLALPAPSKKIEPVKEEVSLANPVGNITKEELGPEVSGYVDQYRKSNNLPPLQSYSIEDVKDAMTQVNPEGEKGALDSILTAKTGFSGTEKYTPDDVINAAVEKNIAYETNGFQDFLQRTTGERDLNAMSEPQLYAAFKALSEMKRESTDEQIVLPEGSNASRFTQDQYNKGLSFVTQQLAGGDPIAASPTREALKGVTGLKTDRDVHTLLQNLIRNEDLNVTKAGDDYEITSATPVKDVRAPLPKGYSIEEATYEEGELPAGFEITPEGKGKPLTTVDLEAEVAPKIERLTGLRQQEAAKMLDSVNKYSGVVKAGQSSLDGMEARGLSGTEAFAKAKAQQARRQDILSRRIQTLMDRIEEMSAPLKAKPVGKKPVTAKKHTLYKDGKALGTFPSRLDAESSMLTQLSDQELDQLSSDTRFGGITDRATKEKERRKAPAGLPVKGTEEGLAKAGVYTKASPEMAELEKKLVAALSKFGLKDVALKVVRAIENNAEGSYEAKLIKIALDASNPIRTMRHEAIHALKELGFFTKDQWRVLENKAKDEWVQRYLGQKSAVYEGKQMSRLDAYRKMGLSESELLEEAIADAFGDFDVNKAPPGMMMALLNKLRNFFNAMRQALTGAGFESAEDIFGKIEAGKLDKQMDKADKAGSDLNKKQAKLSLYGEGVPLSTRGVMDRQTTVAQQELGLKTEAVRNRFNNVREIAIALNQHTKDNYGVMDPNALTSQDSDQIAKAIADEVAYQLQSTSKTGTGLGWYSNNYPKAVKRLAKRFPELGNNEHAQSVFSALVAVTSNGERVAKNIDNAIKLYAKLRDGKPLVAMGNRRATALQNNLVAIRDLLEEHGTDFKRVLLEEITVKEMNAKLREMGEETDSSYLADTVVPAAAVYFGPKLGAFYANLSGSEGYLTMDLWWTRSINRMRGLLMPKATEASIAKFRDMMDQPSATRDEVVAATIPLRNKYEEYGWMTELEHLVKSKEPAKKIKKDAWFDKAEREAGDAYEQLLFEHKLEKMANTIYKNEFEMLEEAPFTATDRKFMYDAARKAQQLLRKEDINLTLADIQAALWYYEKRLYEKLSGRKADDIGYEEAIIAQAGKGDGRARPSVVFSEQQDGRDGPGGKVPVSEQVREEPSKGQKFSLRDPIGLYSELENKIEAGSPKAPAASWKAYINSLTTKGVKPEEIEWSGVNDWLDLQKGTVTKDALLAYLKEGGVRVEETVLGEKGRAEAKVLAAQDIAESIQAGLGEFNDDAQSMLDRWRSSEEGSRIERQSAASLEEMLREAGDNRSIEDFIDAGAAQTDATKYGQYTLPGGNNYREVLLTLPAKANGEVRYDPAGNAKYPWAIIVNGKEVNRSSDEATAPDILQEEMERAEKKGDYKSSHWDKPNVLAHIRVNDRTDADGNKVLFVEELQSDWGQEGKKRGFGKVTRYEYEAVQDNGQLVRSFREKDEAETFAKQRGLQLKEIPFTVDTGIPAAPFVTKTEGWLNLALKRIMVMAAEGGYDKVAFVNGEQSADRYKLSKQIDSLYWGTTKDGGRHIIAVTKQEGQHTVKVDPEGKVTDDGGIGNATGKGLDEVLGKELATKIMSEKAGNLEGAGLDIGGEGMKTFYDTIVPNTVKKLLPKVGGGKMEEVSLPAGKPTIEKAGRSYYEVPSKVKALTQPGFDVTPAMKQKVETTGLPRFSLRDVKSEIESLPNGSKIFSAIKRTTTTREQEGFIERITGAAAPETHSRYRQQALDRYNQLSVKEKELAKDMGGIERLADSNAHSAALMSDLHSGVTAQVLGVSDGVGGVPVFDKGYTTVSNLNGTVKGPIDIFRQLAAYGDPTIYQAYQFWAAVKRGKRLLAEGKEENITPQDLAFAKELERRYPEFVNIQKDWIKFNNGLVKYMVDTGVISDAMGKEWTKYSDYIPFYRQLDGEKTIGPNIFQSISGVKPPKKLKGSEAPLADFLETVVRNTHAAVQAGMKNVAAQRAGELAVQVGIGEKLDHVATGVDIVTALENGKKVSYRVGDPLFVDAVKSLNIPELPFMSFLTAPANLLRNLVTKDPGFMLANLMRDSISAYVTSGANIKPVVDTIQNFTKAVQNKSPEFEVLKKAGVIGGYDYSQGIKASTESFEKELRKRAGAMTKTEKRLKPVTGIWDFLEKGTEASDAATRIAVYKDTLKQTGNEAEALLRSLEVMNFNRKGSSVLIRIVTAGIPFLNARMQGLDVLYRAGLRPIFKGTNPTEREKAIQRTFFVRGAMIMGISLMYAMAVKDDPDYESQEEETKDNNWLVTPLGIRIPTPFEVGFLFKTVPERIYRLAFSGSDTAEEFAASMKRGLVSTFAFNPVPQAVLPIAEAITNYSTFTMRPIVGQNLLSIDPAYQVGPSTSVMAEKVGEALGVSPMKIDHIYKGYTGTMGMYLVDVMDSMFDLFSDNPRPAKRFEQTPVLKRFLIDPEARGNVTAYYAFKHSVDEAVRTVNFLSKRLDEEAPDYEEKKIGLLGFKQYVSSLDKQMTNLQDQAIMIRSSGMPAKEKRDALLEITQIQNELVSDIRAIRKMAKEK